MPDTRRVLRSGSFFRYGQRYTRSTCRCRNYLRYRSDYYGFRVVMNGVSVDSRMVTKGSSWYLNRAGGRPANHEKDSRDCHDSRLGYRVVVNRARGEK